MPDPNQHIWDEVNKHAEDYAHIKRLPQVGDRVRIDGHHLASNTGTVIELASSACCPVVRMDPVAGQAESILSPAVWVEIAHYDGCGCGQCPL